MAVFCGPTGSTVVTGPTGLLDPSWLQAQFGEEDHGFKIRILPPIKIEGKKFPWQSGQKFSLRIRNHQVGSKTFQCHKEVVDDKWQGECVICDQYNKFWKDHFDSNGLLFSASSDKPYFFSGSAEDFKCELRKIKPVERYYFNIIARGEEERGVLKWTCGRVIYAKILEGILGNKSNPNVVRLGDITDPQTGHDLYVKRTMKGNISSGMSWPDYSTSQFMPSTPLGSPEQIELWMSQLHDLTALRLLSPKEDMLVALEDVFGYLGPVNPKQKFRSITDPFEPSW